MSSVQHSQRPGPGTWLLWVQQLQGIAQTGLAFSVDPYDRELYMRLRQLAASIASHHTNAPFERIETLFREESGYATPRLEVRGAVFDHKDRLLLVREVADANRWALPGGWWMWAIARQRPFAARSLRKVVMTLASSSWRQCGTEADILIPTAPLPAW